MDSKEQSSANNAVDKINMEGENNTDSEAEGSSNDPVEENNLETNNNDDTVSEAGSSSNGSAEETDSQTNNNNAASEGSDLNEPAQEIVVPQTNDNNTAAEERSSLNQPAGPSGLQIMDPGEGSSSMKDSDPEEEIDPKIRDFMKSKIGHSLKFPSGVYHPQSLYYNKRGVPNQEVVNVTMDNVRTEFSTIDDIAYVFPYCVISIKHPFNICDIIDVKDKLYTYDSMRTDINLVGPIQIGLSFFTEDGLPCTYNCASWLFHLKIHKSIYSFVNKSVGERFNFKLNRTDGIDPAFFADMLKATNLVRKVVITWVGFNSMYDFGYLVRMLTGRPLPMSEVQFFKRVHFYFPRFYDLRHLLAVTDEDCDLFEVGKRFDVARLAPPYLASSDSDLVGRLFFIIKTYYFKDDIDESFRSVIFNLEE